MRADAAAVAHLPTWGRMPRTTFQRLLVADLLPASVERAIWLDCDVIVAADLGRLWDEDLGGHHLLAAQDMAVPFVSSRLGVPRFAALGIPAGAPYFNAGVMVVNIARWRRDDVAGRVARYLADRGSALFWDQEGLNAVLHDGWGEVNVRWNVNAALAGRAFYRPRHLTPAAQRAVAEDPWILHYCGNLKPWRIHDTGDPARQRYFDHLDRTAWAGWRPSPTRGRRLAAAYETSRLRRVAYPMEAPGSRRSPPSRGRVAGERPRDRWDRVHRRRPRPGSPGGRRGRPGPRAAALGRRGPRGRRGDDRPRRRRRPRRDAARRPTAARSSTTSPSPRASATWGHARR